MSFLPFMVYNLAAAEQIGAEPIENFVSLVRQSIVDFYCTTRLSTNAWYADIVPCRHFIMKSVKNLLLPCHEYTYMHIDILMSFGQCSDHV